MNGLRFDSNQPGMLDRILGKAVSRYGNWGPALRSRYQTLRERVANAWSAVRAWVDDMRPF